ncbi:hypothetical protein UFOVP1382_15 [uncultured Caudovirales phage]|uniref:Uncharacterized protein n=1 Tax=uncultured Caudovirales phage TaxID=2100421 RepID=A0A6J5S369_9CAUD|nr:hypothetical protein UFOVP1382_15 [uncultured Caudovirales phage]
MSHHRFPVEHPAIVAARAAESNWRQGIRRVIATRRADLDAIHGAITPDPVLVTDQDFTNAHDRLGALHKTFREQVTVTDWARCRSRSTLEADGRRAYPFMDGVAFAAACGPSEDLEWLAKLRAQAAERGAEIETRGKILYIVWGA